MDNWPAGTRDVRRKPDGLIEQLITLKTAAEAKRWADILGDSCCHVAAAPCIFWPHDMAVEINFHRITMQTTEERDQWLLTFPRTILTPTATKEMLGDGKTYDRQHAVQLSAADTHEPYATFYPRGEGGLLVLGSRPKAGPRATPAPLAPDLARMTSAELRTFAATKGVPGVDPKEVKGLLIERIKRHLAGQKEAA